MLPLPPDKGSGSPGQGLQLKHVHPYLCWVLQQLLEGFCSIQKVVAELCAKLTQLLLYLVEALLGLSLQHHRKAKVRQYPDAVCCIRQLRKGPLLWRKGVIL